jgi:Erv1 / Alr family
MSDAPSIMSVVMSPNGFPTHTWGAALWRVMHILSFNFPLKPTKQQQQHYFEFFRSLCTVIPCEKCRGEFCKVVENPKSPLYLSRSLFAQDTKDTPGTARWRLIGYVIKLHDQVNRRLGKRPESLGCFEQWLRFYASMRNGGGTPNGRRALLNSASFPW